MIANSKGNIGIAIVIAIIAVLSGVALAAVAFNDSSAFRKQLDGVQQFHLLRSEVGRGRLLAGHFENVPNPPAQTVLPNRSVRVDFGKHRTVYNARTKLDVLDLTSDDTGFWIRSLITGVRGEGSFMDPEKKSPVKRYGENIIRSLQTMALFHYFTDSETYFDDRLGGIVFHQGDIIHGRVHSNTDIYMRRNSWPEFHGLVSTGGKLRVSGGGTNYPREQIILGPEPGLIENYPEIAFDPTAELVRQHGTMLFGGDERDDQIAYVEVDGAAYEMMVGTVVTDEHPQEWIEGVNKFTIYDSYPPYGPVGQEIGVNYIPVTDTLWERMPGGTVLNTSIFVPMELWISGTFSGRQTWASSHKIYLKDDLLYQNTTPGQRPDGIDDYGEQTLPVNRTDYLGVISEEQIRIKYGHWCPIDSVRYKPNTEDIYMYGAYCAIGESPDAWKDGVITIDYWRPKGSTPPQYWRGEFFEKIDLHLFNYPTSPMNPWPQGLDYPWYNPIWPEPGALVNVPGLPSWTPNPHDASEVVENRGIIYVFGSLAQRRRGAVGFPPGNMFDTGIWDIYNEINPNSAPTYGTHAPNRVGYDKRYTEDRRFERTGPPHYPLIRFEGYETEELRDLGYITERWVFRSPPSNF